MFAYHMLRLKREHKEQIIPVLKGLNSMGRGK